MTELAKVEFGTDGIRGIAGEYPLDPETAVRIGRAIGKWVRSKTDELPCVVTGHDTRQSSHTLLHSLIGGILAEGVDVENIGVISTPGLAYVTQDYSFDLGIMISASHNPFDQNGIKVFGADGFKLDDDEEEAIEYLIAEPSTASIKAPCSGFYSTVYQDHRRYLAHLANACRDTQLNNLSIVLDCANGASFKLAPDIFRQVGTAQVIELNTKPHGTNINAKAGSEYVRRDRSTLLETMRANNADLGIAFDGDADRVVFVTPDGILIDGDHMMGILALELKAQGRLRGDTLVATEMSNSGLEHFLAQHGVTLTRTKVGDRYVMQRMREGDFILGGEQAGHIILLDDDLTVGDGIYVALLVAAMVARSKHDNSPTLHELAARIPRYPQVIASAHLSTRIELTNVLGLAEKQQAALVLFGGQGRVNLRFSGTEPNMLRVMVEGGPQTTMQQVIEQAIALSTLVAQATHTAQPVIDLVDCATGAPIKDT